MPSVRIERTPIRNFGLGFIGFDHLQLTFQSDDTNPRFAQDGWFVIEGTRDVPGPILGAIGSDAETTLSEANGGLTGSDLVRQIGTPESRGSRILPFFDPFNAWQALATFAADIEGQGLPYVNALPGVKQMTINSSSFIASILYHAGLDIRANLPNYLRFSPGRESLIGTSSDDELVIEQGFQNIIGGGGNDTITGADDTTVVEKLFGGTGNDTFKWSEGHHIYHGGQTRLDYLRDGQDSLDYHNVGEVTITGNDKFKPHDTAAFTAVREGGWTDELFSIERIKWNATNDIVKLREVQLFVDELHLDIGDDSGDRGDKLDLSENDTGVLINAGSSDLHFVMSNSPAEGAKGVWVESAEWLVGTGADDRVYAAEGVRVLDGDDGADLIDARLVSAFSGTSPEGYDVEIDGGAGDDTIVSGEGRTLVSGGGGADRFVLAAMTSGAGQVEFVIDDASSEDRLFAGYNFFNGSGQGFEGSELLPVLGALGTYEEMVEHGFEQYFQWRVMEQVFADEDYTVGLLTFMGSISFLLDGNDMVIRLRQGFAETVTDIDTETGTSVTYVANNLLLETETIIRVRDFNQGDLGLEFFDPGEPDPVDLPNGQQFHYPNWDAAVSYLTNDGTLTPALDRKPALPEYDPEPAEPEDDPILVSGTEGSDTITVARPGDVRAGSGNDIITGSIGNDIIAGEAGNDTMSGGAGNDIYEVADAGDIVIEAAGGGNDLVESSVDFELPAHVENLTLVDGATVATGNSDSNTISGNDGANILYGGGGADRLDGFGGNDSLDGGEGADLYAFALESGADTIADTGTDSGSDVLLFAGGIRPEDVTIYRRASTPSDLVLALGQGGTVSLSGNSGEFGAPGGIDRVVFASGGEWSRDELLARAASAPLLDNDPPHAADDFDLILVGATATIPASALLLNDGDANGDTLTIVSVGNASVGTVSLNGAGNIEVVLSPGYDGALSFDYTVSDGRGGMTTASVTGYVIANASPVAGATIEDQTLREGEAWSLALPDGLFSDADGDPLPVAVALAGGGAVPDWITFDASTGTLGGTPPGGSAGALAITLTASDGIETAVVGFDLAIEESNHPPTAAADVLTTAEDVPLVIEAATLLANDTDPNGDILSVDTVSAAVGGAVAIDGDGRIVFTPGANINGAASFTYRVADGRGGSASAVVTVMVAAVNDAPAFLHDIIELAVAEDTAIAAAAGPASDVDGDDLAFAAGPLAPAKGTLEVQSGGALSYIPNANVFGVDEFDVRVSDGQGGSAVQRVRVTIAPVADAPAASPDSGLVAVATRALLIDPSRLLANDYDADGDALRIVSVAATDGSQVSIDGTGQIRFLSDRSGPASFSYVVDDGTGATSTATVALVVERNTIQGTAANETLSGTPGDDHIMGGGGNDRLSGLDGSDVLVGGSGNDTLDGGAGDDRITPGGGIDSVVGGAGYDIVDFSGLLAPVQVRLDLGYASTGGGSATLNAMEGAEGGGSADTLYGNAGANRLTGNAGADHISGGAGDDVLEGGAGADRLSGDATPASELLFGLLEPAGNDRIVGGAGDDTMRGGAGADTFAFAAGFGRDVIEDFAISVDTIEFSSAVFANFSAVLAAARQQGSSTIIDAGADDTLTLAGVDLASLGASDFLFT